MLITYWTCTFRRHFRFHCYFSWGQWGVCVCPYSWVTWYFHFRFSLWVLISVYVFVLGVRIACAQLGNGLSLTLCIMHLHPAFPVPVCISKTVVPDIGFSLSVIWIESEFFTLQILPLPVLLSGLFYLLDLLCVFGEGGWFLCFFSAFSFLWLTFNGESPSHMAFLYQPFPPFINFLPSFLGWL